VYGRGIMTITRENLIGRIWVCVDCMMLHANGEMPVDPREGEPEPLSEITEGFEVTAGMLREQHADGCDGDGDCDCETIPFSSAQCEGCGSYLAGERHAMTLWMPEVAA
jgi:hypothetical protein